MAFSETPEVWRMRNIEYGERGTAKKRAELAGYAQILQELKNQGLLDVAKRQQQGATTRFGMSEQGVDRRAAGVQSGLDRRLAANIRVGTPLRKQETEAVRLGNIAEKFYQGLAEDFGPRIMKQRYGDKTPAAGSRAAIPPSDTITPLDIDPTTGKPIVPGIDLGAEPKADVSAPSRTFGQEASDAWDRSTRTPIGRMFDLEGISEALRKTWRGLDYVGKGMEKGVGRSFKYLFTPRKRKEDRTASPFGIRR